MCAIQSEVYEPGGARGVFGINRSRRQCQAFTSPFPSLKLNIEKGASNINLGVGLLYGGAE